MLSEKYLNLGFDISKFGAHSSVLRYKQKPIFVFCSESGVDSDFLVHICNTYLKINKNQKIQLDLKI